jgi:16S rRNA (cytidine1402-2'-O)-methyltransferase
LLYVVATPIGNLGDMSPRAVEVLRTVTLIAAEDTRRTEKLLQASGIATPLTALHDHNEAARVTDLVARLEHGDSIALVSDAGTPLISDPGYQFVRAAIERGLRVVPIPGACAAVTALSVAGLPTQRFAFEGFLASKAGPRRLRLQALSREERTLVFYEAPHRLTEALKDMSDIFGGERPASVGRELTKLFETVYHGTLAELAHRAIEDADMSRGELVVIVHGAPPQENRLAAEAEQVLRVLAAELPPAQAAKLAAKLTGSKRDALYDLAVQLGARPVE